MFAVKLSLNQASILAWGESIKSSNICFTQHISDVLIFGVFVCRNLTLS